MNMLRVTLLSTLMLSGITVFADENAGSDIEQSVLVNGNGSEEMDSAVKTGLLNENATTGDANGGSLSGKFATLALAPVGLAENSIDWVADKAFFTKAIKILAGSEFLKKTCFGNWLDAHNKGLSRLVVLGVFGGIAYYCWNKYQNCADEDEQVQKGFGSEEDGYDSDFLYGY